MNFINNLNPSKTINSMSPTKLILLFYLKQTDDAEPKIEPDENFNEGGEEEEKRDDFQSDEPKGETHAGQVRL